MNSLEVKKFLEQSAKRTNPIMKELLLSYVGDENKEAIKYPLLTGGKRVRPALAIASCRMFGGKLEDVLYPSASLEILHNYSLIIDDMIDNSPLRRGNPTCWAKFGRSIAQCIAIDYSASIFQGANRSKKPIEVSEILARTMKLLVDGEILDILFEQSGRENELYVEKNRCREVTDNNYFRMANKKTSALIQASCEVGGLIAGAGKDEVELLRKYGFGFGMAFQIQDDILDIFGDKKVFGKEKAQDIIDGKLGNIIILFTFRELSSSDKRRFSQIIKKEGITEEEKKEAIRLIRKTSSFSEATKLGKNFIEEAKRNLNLLPQNEWNDILGIMADFVIERKK